MGVLDISVLGALGLSLRVAGLATLISCVAAMFMAWLLARKKCPLPHISGRRLHAAAGAAPYCARLLPLSCWWDGAG